MAKNTITDITILREHKTLKKHRILELTISLKEGAAHQLSVELSSEQICSCVPAAPEKDQSGLSRVAIPRTPTLKTSLRALLDKEPGILECDSNQVYWHLKESDVHARERETRAKRRWRVHEYSLWKNGDFVIRLSCTKAEKYIHNDTQFVLSPQRNYNDEPILRHRQAIVTRHKSHHSIQIDTMALARVIGQQRAWHSLGELLAEATHGYRTELEARAGYQYLLDQRATPPSAIRTTTARNSVRQVGINSSEGIVFYDHIQCWDQSQHWWVKSDAGEFLMSTIYDDKQRLSVPGASATSSLLKGEVYAARHLSAQFCKQETYHQHYQVGLVVRWREILERDYWARVRAEAVHCDHQLHYVAHDDTGTPQAILASFHPEEYGALPLACKRAHYLLLYKNNQGSCTYLTGTGHTFVLKEKQPLMLSYADFDHHVQTLLAAQKNDGSRSATKAKLAWISLVNEGHTCKEYVLKHWNMVTANWTVSTLSPVAALPSLHERQQAYQQTLANRCADSSLSEASRARYQAAKKEGLRFPVQLIEYCQAHGLLEAELGPDYLVVTHPGRHEKCAQLFQKDGINRDDKNVNNGDDKTRETELSDTVASPPGDKRAQPTEDNITENRRDQEEKEHRKKQIREAVRRHRAQAKTQAIARGEAPAKRGRKRIHTDDAAKHRKSRFNIKHRDLSKTTGLLIIDVQNGLYPAKKTILAIEELRYLYPAQQTYFTRYLHDSKQSVSSSTEDKLCTAQGAALSLRVEDKKQKNIYVKSSRNLSIDCMEAIVGSGLKQWLLVGMGLNDRIAPIALQLASAGITPLIYLPGCQSKDAPAHKTGLALLKAALPARAILK